ncbi:hypothetical protein J7643_02285 [bacterium]|nr:hypothetical protein [bacterium]
MKLQQKLGIAVTGAAVIGTLAGCPTGVPSVTPGSQIVSGRVTFGGGNPGQDLTIGLKKFDGSAYQKLSQTTKTDTSGNYAFTDTSLTSGKYQAFYDDGGQEVTDATVNTVGVYVSEAKDSPATINFDVQWAFSPSVTPNAVFTVGTSTFGFAANTHAPGAEYQVAVADANKSVKWSSAWANTTSFSWNGKEGSETNTPTGADRPTGKHYYQIKFRKAGTTFGGAGFYGQTKWVPFTLAR